MNDRFERNSKVEVAPMNRETVLFNPDNNKFCVLNQTAALLWQELGQPRTIEELAVKVCDSFAGVTQDQARQDVRVAIEQFLSIECVLSPGA